jgi:hypothetical protein
MLPVVDPRSSRIRFRHHTAEEPPELAQDPAVVVGEIRIGEPFGDATPRGAEDVFAASSVVA